jgi:hypothetical protein
MRTSGDKKEILPIKNDEESSLVAEGGLFYDPLWITAQVKIPASAFGVCRFFLFLNLTRA